MPEATVTTSPALRSWNRDQRLRKLGFENYAAYMTSPEWAEVKRRYRASLRPQNCGLCDTSEDLHLHHLTYERVGQEELADLVALCAPCHRMLHALERRGDIEGLDFAGLVNHARAEKNRERMRERFGNIVTPSADHRRAEDHRRVIAFAKQMLIEAIRKGVDTSDEVAQIHAIAKSLSAKMMDEAA